MLSSIQSREVETFGVTQSNAFSIKATGKAFKVLIDGLYSDKILAVIRELWTNAYDSHVMAGKGHKPFDCQLPTSLDPVFRVRDYGVSLDHDDVMHLYTTVFESTKEDTNSQVGKWGLGSKSPFAYTDTFTITAWKDGKKRLYSAFIGDKYVPMIAFMGEEDTTEKRGLEISFPVKVDDVYAFGQRAQRVAKGFDVKPRVLGNKIVMPAMDVTMTSKDPGLWVMVRDETRAYARQGCVVYPIDPNAIPGITDSQRAILESPLFINFPIGELEISASREALSYDETTAKNIRAMADRIGQEISTDYIENINKCATFWDACAYYASVMDDNGTSRAIRKIVSERATWKGRRLVKQIDLHHALNRLTQRGVQGGGIAAMHLSTTAMQRRVAPKWQPTIYTNVHPGVDEIVFEDAELNLSMTGVRLKYAATSGAQRKSILWVKGDPKSMAWKRLLVALGRPPVKFFTNDTFPRPPKDASGGQRKAKVKMRVLDKHGNLVEADVDPEDTQVYVRMQRGEVIGPDGDKGGAWKVASVAKFLAAAGVLTTPVIAVPGTHKKKVQDTWVCLWDMARKHVDENFDGKACAVADSYKRYVTNTQGVRDFIERCVDEGNVFASGRPAAELADFFRTASAEAAKQNDLYAMRQFAISVIGAEAVKEEAPEISDEILTTAFEEAYPLAARIIDDTGSVNDAMKSLIVDYVNLIDTVAIDAHSATVIHKAA